MSRNPSSSPGDTGRLPSGIRPLECGRGQAWNKLRSTGPASYSRLVNAPLALRDGGNGLSEMIRDPWAPIECRFADLGVVPEPALSAALSTAPQPKGRPSTSDISPPG